MSKRWLLEKPDGGKDDSCFALAEGIWQSFSVVVQGEPKKPE
jgi:hypothetical protein